MKIRIDFVSNSSSSSFICLLEDNKHGVLLEEFRALTLREYMKEFGHREVFGYIEPKDGPQFITSQAYSKRFGIGVMGVLPDTAKEAYEDYKKVLAEKKLSDLKFGSEEFVEQCKALDVLQARIFDKCIEALELEWGDKKFCFQEVDDNEPFNEELDAASMEELVQEKWDYIDSLKPLKFRREWSNH